MLEIVDIKCLNECKDDYCCSLISLALSLVAIQKKQMQMARIKFIYELNLTQLDVQLLY